MYLVAWVSRLRLIQYGRLLGLIDVGWMAGGELRLDATIKYKPGGEDVFEAHGRWYAEGGWSGLLVELSTW